MREGGHKYIRHQTQAWQAAWATIQLTALKAVHAIVATVAREGGHEVVLLKTDPNQKLNSTNREDFALKTRLRVVVFSDTSCDITQAVIDKIKKN